MERSKKLIWMLTSIVLVAGLTVLLVVIQIKQREESPPTKNGTLKNFIVECTDTGRTETKVFAENVEFTVIVYHCVAKSLDSSQKYELNLELEHAVSVGNASLGCASLGKQLRADVVLDSSSSDFVMLADGYQCYDLEEES